jgi:thioredoxin reductase
MDKKTDFDVVIVGGSYAGLSAAMSLGRALWNVAVIDSGKPCNAQTPHSHNFLTQDGQTPAAITALARQQVLAYPTVKLIDDLVVDAMGEQNDFTVETRANGRFTTKKLLFSTGIKDLLPEIPGFAACWGISVIHCPFCHGYEYKSQQTGILFNGPMAIDLVRLIRNWTPELTLFTNGPATFDANVRDAIQLTGTAIIEKPVIQIAHENGYLRHLIFEDGSSAKLDAMYARPPFQQHCTLPEKLGCTLNEQGYLAVDASQKTNVPGIYAAGDNTIMMRSVANAVAAGGLAGARLSHDLISEQYA